MFTINNTIERLKLNIPGVFGLFDKIGITFPIEWENEDRSREIKYGKIYYFLTFSTNKFNRSKHLNNSRSYSLNYNGPNSSLSAVASSPTHSMPLQSSSDNIFIQPGFSATATSQSFTLSNSSVQNNSNDKQKKSRGMSFFQKKSSAPNLLSPLMLEQDENIRKLVLSTPGFPHLLRRQFWFSVSGGFKLSLQFSDAWEQACNSATAIEGETNLPLTEIDEFDAFLGGRIDTLTFLPPAIQLQVSTFLHVFSHAQCGTVEFAPMISTASSLLLLYLEPSLAYLTLTSMVNRSKTENSYYFILSREALLAESSVFRLLCEKLVKNVVRHADSINVNMEAVHLVCAPMLFFPFLPLQSALTLFDIFMVEGRKFILQFSLALLQSEERNLLQAIDANSFVDVIVNALERLADVDVLKSFILKNVEKIDIGKWRRIISLEENYMDPKNKKMISFVIRNDDKALQSFEHKIETDHLSEENYNNNDYDIEYYNYNSDNNQMADDDENELSDIDINLDLANNQTITGNVNMRDIMNNNHNNKMNSCGSYDNNNQKLEKKPSNSSFNKETDLLLTISNNDSSGNRFPIKNKRTSSIRSSSSAVSQLHYEPKSLENTNSSILLNRNLLLSSNDGIDAAQQLMAQTIKQSLPKIHGGRLLDVNLFYMIRSRLHPVYHRFSCQLVFAKSLNGGSLENLISTTLLSYAPSYSSTSSLFSSNSSIMFSSNNINNINGGNLNLFTDNFESNENDNNNNKNNEGFYQNSLPHIIVIETDSGKKFGALLSDPLKYDSDNQFYGKPITFVFDASILQIYQKFPCPNNFFIKSSPEMLQIGGELPAIKLSADLSAVESFECDTFGSTSLIGGDAESSVDGVKEVEVYRLKNISKRAANIMKYSAKTV